MLDLLEQSFRAVNDLPQPLLAGHIIMDAADHGNSCPKLFCQGLGESVSYYVVSVGRQQNLSKMHLPIRKVPTLTLPI